MTYSNEGKTPNQDSADIKAQQEINIDDLDMETLERLTSPDNDQDPASIISALSASAASSDSEPESQSSSAHSAPSSADPSADDIAYAVDQMASGSADSPSAASASADSSSSASLSSQASDDMELDPSTFAGSNLSMGDDSSDSSDNMDSSSSYDLSQSSAADEMSTAAHAGSGAVSPAGAAVDATINDNESPRLRVYDDEGNELSPGQIDGAASAAPAPASDSDAQSSVSDSTSQSSVAQSSSDTFAHNELSPASFAGAQGISSSPEGAAIILSQSSQDDNTSSSSMLVDSAATDDDNSFELDIQNAAQSMSIYEPDPVTAGSDGKDGLTAQTAAMVASAAGHEEPVTAQSAFSTEASAQATGADAGGADAGEAAGAVDSSVGAGGAAGGSAGAAGGALSGSDLAAYVNTGIRTGGTAPDGARVMSNAQITSEGTSAIIGLNERHVTPVREPSVAVARNMSADDLAILARFNTRSSRPSNDDHAQAFAQNDASATQGASAQQAAYDMSSAAAEVADEAAALFGANGIQTGGTVPDGALVMKNSQITAGGTSAIIGLETRQNSAPASINSDDDVISAAARAVDEAAAALSGGAAAGNASAAGGAGGAAAASAAALSGIRTGGTVPDGAKVMSNAQITSDGAAAIIGLGERHVTPVREPSTASARQMSAEDLAILARFNTKSDRRSRKDRNADNGADSGALIMNESTMSDTGSTAIVGLGESHVTPVQQVNPELNRAGVPVLEDVDSEMRSPYRMQARDHESLHETGSSNIIVDRKHAQNNAPVTTIFENGMVMDEGHTAIMGLENRAAAPERDESSTLITGMQADNLESLHAFNEEYARSKQAHFEANARFRAEMDAERNMAERGLNAAQGGAGSAAVDNSGAGGSAGGAAAGMAASQSDLDSQMLAGITQTDSVSGGEQQWQDYEGSNDADGQPQWPDQRYYASEQPQSAPGEYYDPLYDTVPQRRNSGSWQQNQENYAPQDNSRNDYYNWSEYDQGEVQARPVDRQRPEDDGPHYVVGRQPRYAQEPEPQPQARDQEEEQVYVGTYASRLAREKAQNSAERGQRSDSLRGDAMRGSDLRGGDMHEREQAARNGHVQHFDENGYPVDDAWQSQSQGNFAQGYEQEDSWSSRPQNFGPDGMPLPDNAAGEAIGASGSMVPGGVADTATAMGSTGAMGSSGAMEPNGPAASGQNMGPDGMPAPDMSGSSARWNEKPAEEERSGPVPAGMGDGPLLQVELNQAQAGNGTWEEPADGPVYHVGPKENTRRMQELMAERPVYAIGVKSSNADVMANIEATRNKIQGNRALPPMKLNNDPFEETPMTPEEDAAYEQALAEAARESMAAPQSEVIRRARILAQGDGKGKDDGRESSSEGKSSGADEGSVFASEFASAAAMSGASVDTGSKSSEGEFGSDTLSRVAADASENEEQMLAVQEDRLAEEAAGKPDNREVIEPLNKNGEPRKKTDDRKEPLIARANIKDNVGFGMMIFLYIRQLFASFFTHTTLPLAAPQLAMRLGPCYPSSMPVPFFFVGLLAGLSGSVLHATIDLNYVGSISYLAYLMLTGLTAYKGIYRICSYITRRRHDSILVSASVMVPMLIFIWLANTLIVITDGIVEATAAFAIASMLSAATATSLTWNFPQDPMDSLGRMTTRGLLFVILLSLMAAFGLLNYIVGLSVLGVSIVMRLIFGYFIARNQGTAQRPYVYALQMLTLFAILFDLILLKSQHYEFLSYSTLEFVHFLRSYSTMF